MIPNGTFRSKPPNVAQLHWSYFSRTGALETCFAPVANCSRRAAHSSVASMEVGSGQLCIVLHHQNNLVVYGASTQASPSASFAQTEKLFFRTFQKSRPAKSAIDNSLEVGMSLGSEG